MPSIRIRKSAYSDLEATPEQPATFPRSLANIFGSPIAAQHRPTILQPDASARSHSEFLEPPHPESPEVSMGQIRRRPRASSRVSNHLLNKASVRFSEGRSGARSPRSSVDAGTGFSGSPRDGMITLEGEQADVMVHSDGEPGAIGSALSLPRSTGGEYFHDLEHHHDDIVEHLDVIDLEVSTVSNLTNAANAILIPPSSLYSRKPVVVLASTETDSPDEFEEGKGKKYTDDLDRHVNDVLKRPSKFRRTMRGVWSFLKTPMGVVAAIYGFCVIFWGAAIVFFLAKFINFHNPNTQGFWIEVSSQIENGLFTVTGIGLIPSRVLDTYRICKIWIYKRKIRKLRAKAGLPQLYDVDDLPDPAYDPNYIHVLSEKEQKDLHRQQVKFQHHQTWYRAHGTETHRAFPIGTALLICCLSDGNSIFQIMLCGTMWGLNRFERPPWSTGTLIPASFLCGITAGIFIWRGSQKTKRTKQVEERLRQALETEDLDEPSEEFRKNLVGETLATKPPPSPRPDSRGGYLEPIKESRTFDERMTIPQKN